MKPIRVAVCMLAAAGVVGLFGHGGVAAALCGVAAAVAGLGLAAPRRPRLVPGVLVNAFDRLPALSTSHALERGHCAKVIFDAAPDAEDCCGGPERIWYEILEVHPGPRYRGKLSNVPEFVACPEFLDFGPEHVIAVEDAAA
jgi:hypothetical protein